VNGARGKQICLAVVENLFFQIAPMVVDQFCTNQNTTAEALNVFPVDVPVAFKGKLGYDFRYSVINKPLSIRSMPFFVPVPPEVKSWWYVFLVLLSLIYAEYLGIWLTNE
jgi:hypothetical protein